MTCLTAVSCCSLFLADSEQAAVSLGHQKAMSLSTRSLATLNQPCPRSALSRPWRIVHREWSRGIVLLLCPATVAQGIDDGRKVLQPPFGTPHHAFTCPSAVLQKHMAIMAAADGHVTRSEWVRGIVMMAVSSLRQPIMALVPFMAFTHIVKVLSLAAEIALTVDSAALSSIVGSATARESSPALAATVCELWPPASVIRQSQPCGQQCWHTFWLRISFETPALPSHHCKSVACS